MESDKRAKLGKALIFTVIFVIVAFISIGCVSAATYTVCFPGCNYTSIQAAINAAEPGDTIEVHSGTYYEHVNINKQLILKGVDTDSGKPVVDASGSDSAITLSRDRIMLEGFTVTNSGSSREDTDAGIRVTSDNNIITGNNVSNNNWAGIYLNSSCGNTITGNTFVNDGLFVTNNSHQNTLENNTVNGKPLIYLEQASDFEVTAAGQVILVNCNNITVDNLDLSNTCVGVELLGTEDSIISNNTLSNNRVGICLGYSCNNNNITGNNASNNLIDGIVLDNFCNSNNIVSNSANNNYGGIVLMDSSNNNNITGNNVSNNNYGGIGLRYSCNNNNITGNTASNNWAGIVLMNSSNNNNIIGNNASYNNCGGIVLGYSCNNNNIISNNASYNNCNGIEFTDSNNNNITGNNASNNNYDGISLNSSSNNTITGNNVGYNNYGIYLLSSSNNKIYLNNFINNTNNAYSFDLFPVFNLPTNIGNSTEKITSSSSTNIWNSAEKITYTHNGNTYINYVGNYWSDYKAKYPYAEEIDGCGIWDTPYSIAPDNDFYPLMEPCENYLAHAPSVFDTGTGTYPSIMGTHTGTIKPSSNINVSKLYTYSCAGTGGHTESIKLEENGTLIANGTWDGYHEDWYNITLHNVTDGTHYVTLLQDHEYNYTIRTGSYPQILHAASKEVTGGTITCTSFVDANGKTYTDVIPAIKFF